MSGRRPSMATPAAYTPSKSAGGSGLAAVRARSGSVNHGRGIPHGNIDLAMIQGTEPSSEITVPRKTKIVCTIGPACWSVETLTSMLGLGMTVARLNFSHGDHEGHGSCLDRLREAASSCGTNDGANLAIMMDTKGPEIRTGRINADKVTYLAGSEISITTDYDVVGDETTIACSYKSLCTIAVGQKMLVADGSLVLEVLTADAAAGIVTAKVLNTASIGSFKNMNLPGVIVDLPTMTERDANDIANFAVTREVDMIAASFVRKGSDVEAIRKVIADACVAQGKPASLAKSIKIISKIENQEGLENFADILIASDGIMVARGDLGMELPPEKVFLAQKFMIRQCNIAGKPVITATQMLESMCEHPRATRAECTDVANAVLDGTDCVMLSGETAGGKFPLQAVTAMAAICVEAEKCIDYGELFAMVRASSLRKYGGRFGVTEAIASSAVITAEELKATMIICYTEHGTTARLCSKYRPPCPVYAITSSQSTARICSGLSRGVHAMTIPDAEASIHVMRAAGQSHHDSVLNVLRDTLKEGKRLGYCDVGDYVIIIQGQAMGDDDFHASNTLEVRMISTADLDERSVDASAVIVEE